MSRDVRIEVKGAKELARAFREVEDAAARKGMQADLKSEYRQAAEVVAAAAREEAPKRSGRLRDSIKAKGTTLGASVTVGGTKAVPYAAPIHWGWGTRPNKAKHWRGGPIAANNFILRAAEGTKGEVAEILEAGLRRLIERVMPGG